MSQYANLGYRYLAALGAQLDALLRENEILDQLGSSAEMIAATPSQIEAGIAANTSRIKQLTERIADVGAHLANARVSDF